MPTLKLDAPNAAKLIELLSKNDAFRDQFSTDPLAALLDAGIIDESADAKARELISSCCKVSALASKEAIATARAELDKMLTSGSSQTVPALDANLQGGRTLR